MKHITGFPSLGTLLLGIGLATAPPVEARTNATSAQAYTRTTLVSLPYGDADNAVGFTPGAEDRLSVGPRSFAVGDGKIFVLDGVNAKLKRFDRSGRLLAAVDTAGQDMALANGRVLVAEFNRLASFDTDLRPLTSTARLRTDGSLLGVEDFNQWASPTGAPAADTGPTCTLLNNHEAEISVMGTRNPIRYATTQDLGSAVCLGQDRSGNIFVTTEFLATVNHVLRVTKQVQKLAPDGRLLATLPVPIDYAAHPRRELAVDSDGIVYHMRPLADRLLIQAWRPASTHVSK